MTTPLKKPVHRESAATIREAGKLRQIIISMEPPHLLGFRAKGCRKTYYLTAQACYMLAVKADVLSKSKQRKSKRGKPRKLSF